MNPGAFSKPCEYVGSVLWKWDEEKIVALEIETSAYALADQKPDEYCNLTDIPRDFQRRTIFNRDAAIAWAKEKVAWLFEKANVALPPFEYEPAPLSSQGPYLLVHYVGDTADYVVLVSPELEPEEFCQPGFQVAHTLEVWNADDFPADMPLIPAYSPADPDERPMLKEPESASAARADDWLEASFEDRISGCGE